MSTIPNGSDVLHMTEAVSFAPVLFALLLGSLPVLLPLILCRWVSARIGTDASRCRS
jgi:hypothetical protein